MTGTGRANTWTVNGSALVGSESVGCAASGTLALETKIAGSALTITATSIECIECIEDKITNPGGNGSLTLVLTGLTLDGAGEPRALLAARSRRNPSLLNWSQCRNSPAGSAIHSHQLKVRP
jgi:hypothetical protein